MHSRVLVGRYLEEVSTSAGEEHSQVIVIDMDPSLIPDHLLHNIEVQVAVVHIDLVEEAHEDRYDLGLDKAFYQREPAVADIEAEVATALDFDLVVLVPDDTHLAYLCHSACSQVVK